MNKKLFLIGKTSLFHNIIRYFPFTAYGHIIPLFNSNIISKSGFKCKHLKYTEGEFLGQGAQAVPQLRF